MIPLDEAVELVRHAADRNGAAEVELLPLDDPAVHGRVLAEDLRLDRDHPPFDRATMDGIACRAAEAVLDAELVIVGEVAAGGVPPRDEVPPGAAVRIATGAAIPVGLDTVVERERLTEVGDVRVRVTTDAATPGRHVHRRGIDGRGGDRLRPAGTRLDAITIGLAAAVGATPVPLRRRPRAVIVATGDELRPPEDRLEAPDDAYRIRDGNRPMIAATLRDLGAEVVATVRVADDLDATIETIASALTTADLVITIGGVSAGDRDHVPTAARSLGLQPLFRGLRIQPGRPTAAWCDADGRLRLVGLPGNPVSCLVAAHLIVRPWIDARLGRTAVADWTSRPLANDVHPNATRTACRPAIADGPSVRVPTWNGSGDGPHLAGTTGLVRLPEQAEPILAGTPVPCLPWRPGPDGSSG